MNHENQLSLKRARTATLLIFLLCGLGVATWAPMVPLAKSRLGLNEADLGVILLLLGAGAIVSMPVVGMVIHKTGTRLVILVSTLVIAAALPLLTAMNTPAGLAIVLFLFGAAAGALDIAMNAHAVLVQERMTRHLMSSFHAMFSVGGLIGSISFGFLMLPGLSPTAAALVISLIIIIVLLTQYRHLLKQSAPPVTGGSPFRFPKGPVILIGIFCFIVFLAEGAMLDWSALFLRANRGFSPAMAGAGYAVFSIAMALMRFLGDGMVTRFGAKNLVLWGGCIAASGLLLAVTVPGIYASLGGFMLIGFGAANIVPVLFSAAGSSKRVAPAIALAAVTTMGYAGQLAGPASIGFIAYWFSLPVALGSLSVPLLAVSLLFSRMDKEN